MPQEEAPKSLHEPSGSCPAGTLLQAPAVPGSAHDLQLPVQLDPQHTPCWQNPDAHCDAAVQVVPSACPVQVLPLQQSVPLHWYPAAQSALVAHLVRQSPALPQT